MLLLIGGAPGIGKSTVAAEIARELGLARLIDLDVVRDILRIQSREQDDPMLFRNALNAYELHGPFTPATVLAGFHAHVRPIASAATRLLESYLSTGKSAIFHGVPLLPVQLARYRTRGVQMAVLGARDEETYRNRLGDRGRVRAGRAPALDRLDAGWIVHQHLAADAAAHSVPFVSEATAFEAAAALLRKIQS
jgi:2-phosphoglycerate kinase